MKPFLRNPTEIVFYHHYLLIYKLPIWPHVKFSSLTSNSKDQSHFSSHKCLLPDNIKERILLV